LECGKWETPKAQRPNTQKRSAPITLSAANQYNQNSNSPKPMTKKAQNEIARLKEMIGAEPDLVFAVLIGSRARGDATANSDWDIALKWEQNKTSYFDQLARGEILRKKIAVQLNTTANSIDLIDINSAQLAMRAFICNEGLVLTDPYALPWLHFLQRTWRELEDYHWDDLYVA
jgi:predicted nucleotidyltransferase